jgi:hypothetical protein
MPHHRWVAAILFTPLLTAVASCGTPGSSAVAGRLKDVGTSFDNQSVTSSTIVTSGVSSVRRVEILVSDRDQTQAVYEKLLDKLGSQALTWVPDVYKLRVTDAEACKDATKHGENVGFTLTNDRLGRQAIGAVVCDA